LKQLHTLKTWARETKKGNREIQGEPRQKKKNKPTFDKAKHGWGVDVSSRILHIKGKEKVPQEHYDLRVRGKIEQMEQTVPLCKIAEPANVCPGVKEGGGGAL